jgi:PAS domain S-box-containing protein
MARALIGAGLALAGVLLHKAIVHATVDQPDLSAFFVFVALASLLGGATAGFVCLFALLLAFWPEASAATEPLWSETLFLGGGAIVAGAAGAVEGGRRRRIEAVARRDDEGLRLAVDAAGIGTFEARIDEGGIAVFNAAERKIFGFEPNTSITLAAVDALVHEDDREARRSALEAAADPEGDGVYRAHYRIRRASDGALRWISAYGQAFFRHGRLARVVGLNRDITDEVNAEQILQEKARLAEQLSGLAAALPGAIYTYAVRDDGSSCMPYASPKIAEVMGFGPEIVARDLTEMARRVHIDDLMPLYASIARAANGVDKFRTNFRYNHPIKGQVWIECESAPQMFENGKAVWHGYLQDVTLRIQALLALEESESRLRAVFDGAAEAIFTIDAGGRIASFNAAGLRMFGYAPGEIIGAATELLLPEAEGGPYPALFRDARPDGGAAAPRFEREIAGRRKDGSILPIHLSLSEVRFADTRIFVGFARDLTEQRRIEAHVRQMHDERLATMEAMAAGLAHEINQPLSAASLYLAVARRELEAPDAKRSVTLAQLLEKSAAQVVRAGRIITRVREFSTRGEPDKTFQNLHELIRNVSRGMSEDAKLARFRFRLRLDAPDDRVIVDRVQISQVLVNLLRNAAQAMHSSTEKEIVIATTAIGKDQIGVRIVDQGEGFSAEAAKTLFEPFKSAKPNGMGVGLSISRAIVEAHFGRIWIEPNPPGGAIVNFNLTLADGGTP